MKAAIFYSALTPITSLHKPIPTTTRHGNGLIGPPVRPVQDGAAWNAGTPEDRLRAKEYPHLWVRMEIVTCGDLIHALDKARPFPGETVLNAVHVSE